MNKFRTRLGLLTISCAVLLAAGCTDRNQLKSDLLQASAKQKEAQTYRFSGQADLQLDVSLFQGAPPLTAAMLASLLKDSHFEYSGLASVKEPIRLESEIKVTPKSSSTSINLPILLKDNKLYLHIPAVNQNDEYLAVPLDKKASQLDNTSSVSASAAAKLLEGLPADWLEREKSDGALPGGEAAKRISVNVTEKNVKEASAYFAQQLPALLNEWLTGGLITEAQAAGWKTAAQTLKLQAPSKLELWIDGKGFIRQQQAQLKFTTSDGGPVHSVAWTHKLDAVNEPPAFTKETPAKIKPAEDILRLLKPAAK